MPLMKKWNEKKTNNLFSGTHKNVQNMGTFFVHFYVLYYGYPYIIITLTTKQKAP